MTNNKGISFSESEINVYFDGKKPNPKEILKVPVDMVNDAHLSTLRNYFKKDVQEKYSYDQEVVSAAGIIIAKIDTIINIGKNKISLETMKASNDDNYGELIAA